MAQVMVVDDDQMFREMFIHSLQYVPVEVLGAADGRTAIDMVKSNPPDLVLVDLNMPGISGYEVIRWLKTNNPYIKVVAMTGQDSARFTPEAKMADLMLIKPIPIPTLLQQVASLLAGVV